VAALVLREPSGAREEAAGAADGPQAAALSGLVERGAAGAGGERCQRLEIGVAVACGGEPAQAREYGAREHGCERPQIARVGTA